MDYVYAVVESGRAVPAQTGLDGTALRVVAGGRLAAVVSDRGDARLPVSEQALWEHERVVEGLMSDRPVLPMRFGSVLRDDDAVHALLVERREELGAALRRVSGAVELGVRAAWDPAAAAPGGPFDFPPGGPGAAYLLGLSRCRQRARALAERLDRAVDGLCRMRVQRLLTEPSVPVRAAYLVDRGGIDSFRRAVATLDAEVGEARISCTGPWPPYSFTAARDA